MPRNETHGGIGPQRSSASIHTERGIARHAETGSIPLESLLEFLLVLLIAPPLLCCMLQGLLALVGLVLPWLALVAIVAIVVGALAAAAATPRHSSVLPDRGHNDLPPPRSVRRPPGDRGFRP